MTIYYCVFCDNKVEWYNAGDTHTPKLPLPVFVGDSWEIANKVSDELSVDVKV